MKIHPLRTQITNMLHERALPIIKTPFIARSWVFLVEDNERYEETKALEEIAPDSKVTDDGSRFVSIYDRGGKIFEKHGEFSTYFNYHEFSEHDDYKEKFGFGFINTDNFNWLDNAVGELFRSVEIAFIDYEPDEEKVSEYIDLAQCVCCDVFDNKARIWSDFRLRSSGAGRILVHDKGLQYDETARLLQTLIEVGQYRKLALLGFPVARQKLSWLKGAEWKLGEITAALTTHSTSQEIILGQITQLSAEVEKAIHDVRLRFGATEAYYRLTKDRLRNLRETRVDGHSTMQEFIQRRLTPAMRTCEAVQNRLEDISERVGRVNDLLRSRISISLEVQNQELLKSMDVRSSLQVKLSELVEGLSIFAIGYYIFSLVKYVLDSIFPHSSDILHLLYGPIIIIILITAYIFIHYRKKKITKKH